MSLEDEMRALRNDVALARLDHVTCLRLEGDDAFDALDVLSPSDSGNQFRRADTAEIDAARKREGLPARPRPTRPPPLEQVMSQQPALGHVGPPLATRDAEIDALQDRISRLEALVERDEAVLRKLLALLVDKNVATRDEILERIR